MDLFRTVTLEDTQRLDQPTRQRAHRTLGIGDRVNVPSVRFGELPGRITYISGFVAYIELEDGTSIREYLHRLEARI